MTEEITKQPPVSGKEVEEWDYILGVKYKEYLESNNNPDGFPKWLKNNYTAPNPIKETVTDGVEFLEWFIDEHYVQSNRNPDKFYEYPFKEDSIFYTTAELYTLFQKSKTL